MIPPLVPVTVAWIVGILIASRWVVAPAVTLVLGAAGALLALLARRRTRVSVVGVLLLWWGVAMVRATSWRHLPPNHVAFAVGAQPTPIVLHGVVVNDPTEPLSPNEPAHQVCVLNALHVRDGAGRSPAGWRVASGLVRARIQDPRLPLSYGDEVVVEGRWSSVPSVGNPGQFDWRAALARQQIHALLSVQPFHGIVRLGAHRGRWWVRVISRLRKRLETVIVTRFSEPYAGLLRSFLLGERVALDESVKWAFVETGTMHLVVISGFNVGLIVMGLELLLRLLGLPLRPRLLCSAIFLFGYCALTGMQPPVTRATIMAWVVMGAIWLDRVVNWPNALAAAALIILWANPAQLFDPGFQLSFGAVLSLLVLTTRLRSLLEPRLPSLPEWLRRYVAVSIASTVAIWIGIWPLLAWYFHLVSPVSILANLVLVPLVSLLVGVGTPVLMAGAVVPAVAGCFAPGLERLVDLILGCVHAFHRVPCGWWLVGHPSWLVIIGYYGLVVVSLLRRRLRVDLVWVLAGWLIGLNVWLWGTAAAQAVRSRWLEVTVLDVGHGDSIVIRTPSQHTLLVDAGTDEAGQYRVVPFLRFKGWQTVDALIVTHPDADHVGGALSVLRHARVMRLFSSGARGTTPTARQVWELAAALGLPHDRLSAGMRLTGASGVEMVTLHPPAGFVPGTDPSSNDNSVVVRVSKGETGFLFCGDLEERGVPWLLRTGQPIRSTLLKVPHHGSALGPWGRSFVEQVHPSVAVISVGQRRGLPASVVLRDLDAVGARTLLTRRDGAVTLRTDGTRLLVETFREPHDTASP